MERYYLTIWAEVNTRWRGRQVGIKLHEINTSHRLVTGSFHAPGAKAAVPGSHGLPSSDGMSLCPGPISPLNQSDTSLFHVPFSDDQIKGLLYLTRVLYSPVHKQWQELSNGKRQETTGQSCFSRPGTFLALRHLIMLFSSENIQNFFNPFGKLKAFL